MKKAKVPVWLLVILLLFASLLPVPPSPVSAAQCPNYMITIDSPIHEAHIGPGESGVVEFSCYVEACCVGPGQRVTNATMTLDAEVIDQNWTATIVPDRLEFDMPGTKPFCVTVQVPHGLEAGAEYELVVHGRVIEHPEGTVEDIASKALIIIVPYCVLTLECLRPIGHARPGGTAVFEFRVRNDGNGPQRVNWSLTGGPVAVGAAVVGVGAGAEDGYLVLNRSEERIVWLTVRTNTSAAPGSYGVGVHATAASLVTGAGPAEAATEGYSVTLVIEDPDPGFGSWLVAVAGGVVGAVGLALGLILVLLRRRA